MTDRRRKKNNDERAKDIRSPSALERKAKQHHLVVPIRAVHPNDNMESSQSSSTPMSNAMKITRSDGLDFNWFDFEDPFGDWEQPRIPLSGGTPLTITIPTTALISKCMIALGPNFSQDYRTWNWLDISSRIRWDLGMNASSGKRDRDTDTPASVATFKLDNRDGFLSRQNPLSPYFGLLQEHNPIWISNDPGTGFFDEYFGFTSEIPKRWGKPTTESVINITCRGPIDFLSHQQDLKSPLHRSIIGVSKGDFVPHAYWPMEDQANATQFASAIAGQPPMNVTGSISFASNSLVTGSDPLPVFSAGSSATATIPPYTNTGRWAVSSVVIIPSEPASETVYIEYTTTGAARFIRISVQPGSPATVWAKIYDEANNLLGGTGKTLLGGFEYQPTEAEFFGHPAFIAMGSIDDGATFSVYFSLTVGTNLLFGSQPGLVGDHGIPTTIKTFGIANTVISHHAVFTDPDFIFVGPDSDAEENAKAMHGFDGEMTHVRLARIFRELDLPFFSQANRSARCGPQRSGRVIDVVNDAVKSDLGTLYEKEFGYGYKSLDEYYNQPMSQTFSIVSGHITEELNPKDDTTRFHNQFTARRDGGSFAVEQKDGGLSSADSVWPGGDTFKVYSDSQLRDIASWMANRDSQDTDKWPDIPVYLHKNPNLIPAYQQMPFGGRFQVTGVMSQAGIQTLDLIMEGKSVFWNSKQYQISYNASDASFYDITITDSDEFRVDSGSSSLAANLNSTDTSLQVVTTNNKDLWALDGSSFYITLGGERMRVTNVTGAASPQTFTVDRSINGIVKSHILDPFNPRVSEVHTWPIPRIGL